MVFSILCHSLITDEILMLAIELYRHNKALLIQIMTTIPKIQINWIQILEQNIERLPFGREIATIYHIPQLQRICNQ